MRRISRLNRSIDCIRLQSPTTSPFSYTCIACRQRAHFTTSLRRVEGEPRQGLADRLKKTIGAFGLRSKQSETTNEGAKEEANGEPKTQAERMKDVEEWATKEGLTEEPKQKQELIEPPVEPYEQEQEYDPSPKAFTDTRDIPGDYTPAQSWEGLEQIGGRVSEWQDEWDFKGFIPAIRPLDNDQITVALHRAVVEVYTLQQARKPLDIPSEPLSKEQLLEDITTEVQFVVTGRRGQLKYTEEQTQEKILQSLESAPKLEDEPTAVSAEDSGSLTDSLEPDAISAEESTKLPEEPLEESEEKSNDKSQGVYAPRYVEGQHKPLIASWDPTWLQVSLEAPLVKFAVLKRTLQLTGIRVPDSQIASIKDVQTLLARLVTPPKPRKLAETLERIGELDELTNVRLSDKRITPIHNEVSVGRWKVIKRELERRGLPTIKSRTVHPLQY